MTRKRQYTKRRQSRKVDWLKVIATLTGLLTLVKLLLEIIKLLT